jgi:hypothetical protein
VPTVVPPEAHEYGGDDSGPNTVNVTVPTGVAPPATVAAGAIGLPAYPLAGALADNAGLAGAASAIMPWVLPEASAYSPAAAHVPADGHDTELMYELELEDALAGGTASRLPQAPAVSVKSRPCLLFELS